MYECKRCGYTTDFKANLKRHLEKKRPCQLTVHDDSLQNTIDLLNELSADKRYKENKHDTCIQKYECNECKKQFRHIQSLSRHKKLCKKSKSDEILRNEIEELKQLLHEHMADTKKIIPSIPSSGTTNNTTNNITNNNINIILSRFGHEDRSYIPEAFLTKCLRQKGQGVVELAKVTHFHPNHPNNHNIKAKNFTSLMKQGGLNVFNGDRWEMVDRDLALKNVFDNNYFVLDYHMGSNEEKLRREFGTHVFNNVEAWFDKMRNYDDKNRDFRDIIKKLRWMVLSESENIGSLVCA